MQTDLKVDFGGWLDAEIKELDEVISNYDEMQNNHTSKNSYVQRRFALCLARSEFWEVLAR